MLLRSRHPFLPFILVAWAAAPVSAQVGVCTSPNQNNCYRYLCNGMDASGSIQNSCNSCTDNTAPRWYQPTVPVRVDRTTVPTELGASDWGVVVDGSFGAWANVGASNLVFQDLGQATTRGFGTNETQHEIFWIRNVNEWRQKVGGGENGALGVTLPLYGCGNPGQIYDADLAMNGVGFEWGATQADCAGNNNCVGARSTLLHELGHFIGLGHPCALCSWSIMSAQAGYDPEYPLGVDQAALAALYPGQAGGLGYGCATANDCDPGLSCITSNDIRFCSSPCGSCPEGFSCNTVAEGDFCTFSAGELAGAVGVGESCTQRPCAENLLCVGSGTEYTCTEECNPSGANTCGEGYSCFELQGGLGACFNVTEAGAGQFCDGATVVCSTGLSCVAESATVGYCRRDCDPNNGSGCLADEQCLGLVDQNNQVVGGACFPYGTMPEGATCSGPSDCARGSVCLIDNQITGSARCYLRCDDGFQCVSDRQTCVNAGDISYCSPLSGNLPPLVDAGPGGGTGGGGTGGGGTGGGGTGGGGGAGDCDLRRGHYDCDNGFGCVDDGNGDTSGICEPGAEGETGIGGLCEDDAACEGGICHNGVCTRPCDVGDGCKSGYVCDTDLIPGGLCKADSCKDDPTICPTGWSCEYSSAQRYVCAVGAPKTTCACSGAGGERSAGAWAGLLALLGLLGRGLHGPRRRTQTLTT